MLIVVAFHGSLLTYGQVKDSELVKEPVVRIFLKLPMTTEDVEKIASGVEGDGLLGGCGTFKSLYQVFIDNIKY